MGLYDFYITNLKIENLEAPSLMFECRHSRELKQECISLGYTVFEIRHTDNDWSIPDTIERAVCVNFWGYIALINKSVIALIDEKLQKDTFFQVNCYSLKIFGEEVSFCSNSKLPAPHNLNIIQ